MRRRKRTEFGRLRAKYFMTPQQAAEQFGVTVRTIRNWDKIKPNRLALRELMRRDRDLGGLHPSWAGFRIGWDGAPYGPNRLRLLPEVLRRSSLMPLGPESIIKDLCLGPFAETRIGIFDLASLVGGEFNRLGISVLDGLSNPLGAGWGFPARHPEYHGAER